MNKTSLRIKVEGITYKTCGIIGEGGAGIVYLAKDVEGKGYAIKMIKDYNNPVTKHAVDAEISIQKEFEGSNYVIQYIGVQKSKKQCFIVLELGEYTLKNCVDMRRMNQFDLVFMLCDVLQGLLDIHNKKKIHRDIKPENIIFKEGNFKITDFGVSSEQQEDPSLVGTPIYLPPQVIFEKQQNYTKKVDLWSLGISAFESYFRINPFYHKKQEQQSYIQVIKEVKKNIEFLTPKFNMNQFIEVIESKGLEAEAKYVRKKLANTKEEIIQNLCKFLEPDPEKRQDTEIFLVTFMSIRDGFVTEEVPKSRLAKNYKWADVPFDLMIFCRAKDLFYELNNIAQYEKTREAIFALQLGIWYIEGKNYSGKYIIELEQITVIKDYKEPVQKLWEEVKFHLRKYYEYLTSEDENEYFNKINELRLYILICSVWFDLNTNNNMEIFCEIVRDITNLQINTIVDVFDCFSLYSRSSFNQIEMAVLSLFYYQ